MPGASVVCVCCGKTYEVPSHVVDDHYCSYECWEHDNVGSIPEPVMDDWLEAA